MPPPMRQHGRDERLPTKWIEQTSTCLPGLETSTPNFVIRSSVYVRIRYWIQLRHGRSGLEHERMVRPFFLKPRTIRNGNLRDGLSARASITNRSQNGWEKGPYKIGGCDPLCDSIPGSGAYKSLYSAWMTTCNSSEAFSSHVLIGWSDGRWDTPITNVRGCAYASI